MVVARLVRSCWAVLTAVAVVAPAATALAHHSFAMFDNEHQIKLKGKVTDFQWTNPHVYIEIDAVNVSAEKPETQRWTIECASPGILNRIGWKFNMV